jgi:hypothetical protein
MASPSVLLSNGRHAARNRRAAARLLHRANSLQCVNVLMFGNLLLIVCRAMSTPIAIP